MALTVFLGVAMEFGSIIFTKDKSVLRVIHKGIPVNLKNISRLIKFSFLFFNHLISHVFQFVAGMQTINSLAFVFDGINFGASDYRYCAYSMVMFACKLLLEL
jgi:hypothetical protein